MRIGIVASSEGQTFDELVRAVEGRGHQFFVVADRPCGIEDMCSNRGIPCKRIVEPDRVAFSRRAGDLLRAQEVDFVLLYFNRLVSPELHGRLATFNPHAALLPAFPGLRALEDARRAGVRFLGATLHLVTEEIDGGPIVAQVCSPIDPAWPEARLLDISFVQRVHLSLLIVELSERGALRADAARGTVELAEGLPMTPESSPALHDPELVAWVREMEEARARPSATAVDAGGSGA